MGANEGRKEEMANVKVGRKAGQKEEKEQTNR